MSSVNPTPGAVEGREFCLARVEANLLRALSECELPADRAVEVRTTFAGRAVVLRVLPSGATRDPADGRSECERDCIEILRRAGVPLTRVKLIDALEAANKTWGESTVGNALAALVYDRVLENSRKRGGYYLAGQ